MLITTLQNIDDLFLFDSPFLAAVNPNSSSCDFDPNREDKLNSGLMVVAPSMASFGSLSKTLSSEAFAVLSAPSMAELARLWAGVDSTLTIEKLVSIAISILCCAHSPLSLQKRALLQAQLGPSTNPDCSFRRWDPSNFLDGGQGFPKPWAGHTGLPACFQPWYDKWGRDLL